MLNDCFAAPIGIGATFTEYHACVSGALRQAAFHSRGCGLLGFAYKGNGWALCLAFHQCRICCVSLLASSFSAHRGSSIVICQALKGVRWSRNSVRGAWMLRWTVRPRDAYRCVPVSLPCQLTIDFRSGGSRLVLRRRFDFLLWRCLRQRARVVVWMPGSFFILSWSSLQPVCRMLCALADSARQSLTLPIGAD